MYGLHMYSNAPKIIFLRYVKVHHKSPEYIGCKGNADIAQETFKH